MKQQQVNKLYNKLTPNEQAALVFEAAIRKDEKEADLILDSVKMRTYSMPNLDYQQRITGLNCLSGVYGIAYWKALCQLSLVVSVYQDDAVSINESAQRYVNKLCSMDAALEVVCRELKVDSSVIKKFAECDDYHPNFDRNLDEQLVEQYTELFSQVAYLKE
jgi:predicted ribosome quality control (RQC) complex YloA/Tae2 family protein